MPICFMPTLQLLYPPQHGHTLLLSHCNKILVVGPARSRRRVWEEETQASSEGDVDDMAAWAVTDQKRRDFALEVACINL